MNFTVLLTVCVAFLIRADAINQFNLIFDVSRSVLNTTYNVMGVMERILDFLPSDVVRKYVPKDVVKELYTLINSETLKQVENKRVLSGMVFKSSSPHVASSTLQDLSQVGELSEKVQQWAMRVYSPGMVKIRRPWMLFDRDPRWYPDCIGRYRCKKANDFEIYEGSRAAPWKYPSTDTLKPKLGSVMRHLETDIPENNMNDTCNSQTFFDNTTVDAQHGIKQLLHGTWRVRPRDFKVIYLN